jgi:hypothetical protein
MPEPSYRGNCSWAVGTDDQFQCAKPGVWHVRLLRHQSPSGFGTCLACSDHFAVALTLPTYVAHHPRGEECWTPYSVWTIHDGDIDHSHCAFPVTVIDDAIERILHDAP